MKKLILLICASAGGLLAQAPTIAAVVNNAIQTSTVLCPGLLAAIYGTGFGSGATTSVHVYVGGQPAFVVFVSPTETIVQLAFNVPVGASTVTVTTAAGSSTPFGVTIAAVAPGLPLLGLGNTGFGSFTDTKTYISASNLAQPGEALSLYAIGLGATNPVIAAGASPTTSTTTVAPPMLTVGGTAAAVSFSGYIQPGLYQINFTVPTTVQGSVPVVLSIDGVSSNTVTLPISGISAVVNGASFLNTSSVAPGEMVSLFANGFGSASQGSGFPATTAQGFSVTFNGTPAPIYELIGSASQINVFVPTELATSGTVQVHLNTPAGATLDFPLALKPSVPGIFLIADPKNPAATDAAAQFANTNWDVLPTATALEYGFPTNCTVSKANPATACAQPAAPGDYLVVYTTGLGAATPNGDPNGTPIATGVIAPANGSTLYETIAKPIVKVGGIAATPLFSGIAPGTAGEYQVNFQVPQGVPEGDAVPLTITMPGSTTGTATLSIHSR
ncbi:MAG: hypothetical protein ABSH31_16915 [Bryobacteraceae bacterium]|jgi:uncharacterized protein (TIGR03437 family)